MYVLDALEVGEDEVAILAFDFDLLYATIFSYLSWFVFARASTFIYI